jgi:hypothetical protein
MRISVMRGMIDRRILVNYHVDPAILEGVVPPPFRPKLIHGMAMAGICLIRLRQIRPRAIPSWIGIESENAAHRIAVEWDEQGARREGVFIPRRDTSSWLNTLAGGRLFPAVLHHARFQVAESSADFRVKLDSDDATTHLLVEAHLTSRLPTTSIFASLDEASSFFERGSVGYSPAARPGTYDGLELRSVNWHVDPLAVSSVTSSFFEDLTLFPAGSVAFDSALLMRHIAHEWCARATMC